MSDPSDNPQRKRNNAQRILKMQLAMAVTPRSYDELAQISGLNKPAVARFIKTMKAEGAVHRAAWGADKNGRAFLPLFRWGEGSDVERPGPSISPAERMARLRLQRKL